MADKVEQKPSMGWMLMGLLGLQLAVAVPTSWVLASYFKVDVPASLMFFGNDSWCDIPTEAFGVHCFGDFHERFLISTFPKVPWPNNMEMSPIGPFLTQTADTLAVLVPSRLVLSLVVLIYAVCLVIPSLWASRGTLWPLRFLIVGITGIATYPFLATMDRLNSVALTVPLILIFLVALSRGNNRGVLLSVLALSVIKPQFMVLYLVLVAHRLTRVAIAGMLASALSILALVVGAGGGDFSRISEWFAVIAGYGSGSTLQTADRFSPINISFSRLVYMASKTLESMQQALFGSHLPIWEDVHSSLVLIQVGVFLIAAVILALWGGRIPPLALGIAALVLSTLVLGEYVAAYYTAFALPVCALFLRGTATKETRASIELDGEIGLWSEHQKHPTLLQWTAFVATTLSCSLLIVPAQMAQGFGLYQDRFHRVAPIMQNMATATWLLFLGVACGVAVRSVVRGKPHTSHTDPKTMAKAILRSRS